ncbi:monocarboxylate transporter 13-like [Patiria miniata]|uniref:Major facilitator superfamily (MFS) profile domain-containing protein n=1 Tax=Patiria miniata TaxID=46514 RepID=A0A914ARB6_PATMI|nr:monocarboxylate transporter 13-like [Patiria miniata]XP_038066205.1 monocarboxylate transporter 13-like [Patiria miniata]XP_038066210.1 monocarboxylate transporter 13-like [Patiria miniata]XP_038066216.1 monocarboxylate transporter 13-like [Patiria miniata]
MAKSGSVTIPETEPPYGWVVVASSHVVFILWTGFVKTIGVLLPSLMDFYHTDALALGWITASFCATNNIAAVFGSVLSILIGGRQVVILGGLMATSGLLLASISSSLYQFALALIFLTGSGFGMVMCVCKVHLGLYFNERLAFASSIVTMGVPVGLIIFPAFAELLRITYGIRGTLLILSALTMHLVACGALLRPSFGISSQQRGGNEGYALITSSETEKQSHPCHILRTHLAGLLDVKLLASVDMWMLIVCYTLASFVNDSWITFMVSNAVSKGFDDYVATTFSITAGCSAVIFSVLQGIIITRGIAGIRPVTAVATAIGSTALFLNPLLTSYSAILVAVVMYGISLAVLNPSFVTLAIETQGRERASKAFGWMGLFSGIFRLLFGFSTGLLRNITGYYNATFILLGAMLAIIIPTLFLDTLVSKMLEHRLALVKQR